MRANKAQDLAVLKARIDILIRSWGKTATVIEGFDKSGRNDGYVQALRASIADLEAARDGKGCFK